MAKKADEWTAREEYLRTAKVISMEPLQGSRNVKGAPTPEGNIPAIGGNGVTRAFETQYDEETYLFQVVGPRFRETGRLDAYDFFFIVRWKANRAISRLARRLLSQGGPDLPTAVSRLAADLLGAKDPRERFCCLLERWQFRLPIASAVLTVLYPEEFTVYDVRACKELGRFQALKDCRDVADLWSGYLEFKAAVEAEAPAQLSLRDKDRFLWARSRHNDLVRGIERRFGIKE